MQLFLLIFLVFHEVLAIFRREATLQLTLSVCTPAEGGRSWCTRPAEVVERGVLDLQRVVERGVLDLQRVVERGVLDLQRVVERSVLDLQRGVELVY